MSPVLVRLARALLAAEEQEPIARCPRCGLVEPRAKRHDTTYCWPCKLAVDRVHKQQFYARQKERRNA
jgi:uncharacterized C2H2 Zn-finger protein